VSCIGKQLGKAWNLNVFDLRFFAGDKHKTIDDEPFGGGGGMIMKCNIVDRFFQNCPDTRKLYMSPRGKIFNQEMVPELITQDLCILCARYEGVDARVIKHWNVEEISLGDFILHGGEIAALALIESCARVLSVKEHSINKDSFSNGLLEHDHYTRPACWIPEGGVDGIFKKSYDVPEVLISGNHRAIDCWRRENSLAITKEKRSDLWEKYLSKGEKV
jgi:tRNA (guanine37-N1)-methyltransferase